MLPIYRLHFHAPLTHISEYPYSSQGISIFFMDIVGFTPLAGEADPQDVMRLLNELFSVFDDLCTAHGVYKVWKPRLRAYNQNALGYWVVNGSFEFGTDQTIN